MVYNTQRYWVFGPCPSSGFFLNNNEKHNVSETGSVRRYFNVEELGEKYESSVLNLT
jgi:hypothetical protein